MSILISCALITSGCAAGFSAPTNQQKPTGNGRTATVGTIEVRGATVVVDPAKPATATFVGTIINTADQKDTLTALQVGSAIGTTIQTEIPLLKQQAAQIGYKSDQTISIPAKGALKAGDFVNVRLLFANNDAIPMSLLVNNNDGVYEGVSVP